MVRLLLVGVLVCLILAGCAVEKPDIDSHPYMLTRAIFNGKTFFTNIYYCESVSNGMAYNCIGELGGVMTEYKLDPTDKVGMRTD